MVSKSGSPGGPLLVCWWFAGGLLVVVVVVVTRTVVVVVVVEVVVMLYHNLAMYPGIFLISDVHGLLYSECGLLLSAIRSQNSSALKCYYVVCKDIHNLVWLLLCFSLFADWNSGTSLPKVRAADAIALASAASVGRRRFRSRKSIDLNLEEGRI